MSKKKIFGSGGLEGIAVTELTPGLALNTGKAIATLLCRKSGRGVRVLIGKDTRITSDIIESALCAGLMAAGADVVSLGVAPAPAVAYLTRHYGADGGIMISSPRGDVEKNAVRMFSGNGGRIPKDTMEQIEALVYGEREKLNMALKSGASVGRRTEEPGLIGYYIRHIRESGEKNLAGLKIAVDCANGAVCSTAQRLFTGLEAKVYLLNCQPDGINVNRDCGVSHSVGLIEFMKENGCDCGLAFDADGGRCVAVDEEGNICDGDKLTAIFAGDMQERGVLKDNAVVVPASANVGFTFFAQGKGIKIVTSRSDSRYMTERLYDGKYSLGGEQSGRIYFPNISRMADGQLTAIQLLSVMKRTGKPLSELAAVMERYPQVMVNVKIDKRWKEAWKNNDEIEKVISECEKQLKGGGRIIVRESSKEPVIRVMVEGKRFDEANTMAMRIAKVVKQSTM
ncbi:MAG: phosphoglucosamine mutase [Oscillospiraceae bacterium]|nr:phosphoglucosamine mutase [Oscillospiraceae bacterium]